MRRTLARVRLVGAIVLAALGAVLLVSPYEAAGPPTDTEVATAPLVLPESRVPHAQVGGAIASSALADAARIRIARLRIDLPIEPGDSARDIGAQATPTAAAYLLPGSAPPGTPGNAYIYAHARPGLFIDLWSVRLGDIVDITGPSEHARQYLVTEIHPRVDPTDLRYLEPTDDERLTLQTSTGSWTLSPRFVVIARPIP